MNETRMFGTLIHEFHDFVGKLKIVILRMAKDTILKDRHEIRADLLCTSIKWVRDVEPEVVKKGGVDVHSMTMAQLEENWNNLCEEPGLGELLAMAGKPTATEAEQKNAINIAVLLANDKGQPKGQKISVAAKTKATPGTSAGSSKTSRMETPPSADNDLASLKRKIEG
ncbi:unnamed protein product [Owenia fusiformis]|uniref:Uncharacterized protein n=1 Tax=Owenia fusiformis TaxID=6347 RepID=A0A8S4PYA5_OWEFU|nr:unnamed protein product [Owenia fusiformis]